MYHHGHTNTAANTNPIFWVRRMTWRPVATNTAAASALQGPHRRSAAAIEYAGPALSSSTHDSVTDGRLPGREPPPERLCMVTLPPKNSAQITCTVLSSGSRSTTYRGTSNDAGIWRGA